MIGDRVFVIDHEGIDDLPDGSILSTGNDAQPVEPPVEGWRKVNGRWRWEYGVFAAIRAHRPSMEPFHYRELLNPEILGIP